MPFPPKVCGASGARHRADVRQRAEDRYIRGGAVDCQHSSVVELAENRGPFVASVVHYMVGFSHSTMATTPAGTRRSEATFLSRSGRFGMNVGGPSACTNLEIGRVC